MAANPLDLTTLAAVKQKAEVGVQSDGTMSRRKTTTKFKRPSLDSANGCSIAQGKRVSIPLRH